MKRIFLIAALAASAAAGGFAQSLTKMDGFTWTKVMSPEMKTMYVAGVMDGLHTQRNNASGSVLDQENCLAALTSAARWVDISRFSIGVIQADMDAFYAKTSEDMDLRMSSAFIYVARHLNGAGPEELADVLKMLRDAKAAKAPVKQ